jgi:ribosome-associated translation inhibitor RaiA
VEAWCRGGSRTYRAHANGQDVDSAVDLLVERLERQISEDPRRRRSRRRAEDKRRPPSSDSIEAPE